MDPSAGFAVGKTVGFGTHYVNRCDIYLGLRQVERKTLAICLYLKDFPNYLY